ncbi:MAG: sigma-70 family RNA polymerase sigma factor [Deltaproteobacteria bacterium]|nr:sigma-70 family RNA polymerase sigma factor [Deltaproteobacteria bacterium]
MGEQPGRETAASPAEARGAPLRALPDLDAIYDEEAGRVYNCLRRLGVTTADLEDATHDVFLVLHRLLPTYDPSRPLRPWLMGITARVAANHRRKVGRRREDADEAPEERVAPGRNAEQLAQAGEERAMVQRVLDELDETQRTVLVLHEVEGHSMPDLARELAVPVNTLYSRLRLARARFITLVQRSQQTGGRP